MPPLVVSTSSTTALLYILTLLSYIFQGVLGIYYHGTYLGKLVFTAYSVYFAVHFLADKIQFAEVSAMVINAKDALENIREQSKNIE